MNILLTGASGFTGRHFLRAASAGGHQITTLKSDLTNKALLENEVRSLTVDAVVHLAGISFVGHEDPRAFYDVNLFGTLNLLEALAPLSGDLRCVLLASSANVYGNCDVSPISESQPPAPVNHYAMSKLAMEYLARTRSSALPIIVARPFNYTGPGQDVGFLIPKLVDHCARRAPYVEIGNLDVEREFNDVRVVCDTYLRLIESGKIGETYNVCTGSPHSPRQVLALLKKLTGHVLATRVNHEFVRPNELRRLCGSPEKLMAAIGELRRFELADTLNWMLDESREAERLG